MLLSSVQSAERVPPAPAELLVGTFNLRYASTNKPNAWPDRRPVMKALLDQYQPDILGTQEGLYSQLKDIAADQPAYDWIGMGREGGSRSEFMAVFFKRTRFEPMEYDHFWLSDTPEVVGSSTWGHSNRRMVTWVRFRDRVTGREFYFWNTHLDHQVQTAREKAATLINARIAKVNPALPLLLAGDFNAIARDNKAYDILVRDGGMRDTWYAAAEHRNENLNSFHGYEPPRRELRRIDWILSRGALDVRATEVIDFRRGDQFPSDHFPVFAWLTLKPL